MVQSFMGAESLNGYLEPLGVKFCELQPGRTCSCESASVCWIREGWTQGSMMDYIMGPVTVLR